MSGSVSGMMIRWRPVPWRPGVRRCAGALTTFGWVRFLDFGELCLEGIGQGARRAHRHLLALSGVVDAPQDAVDAVGAWMMTILAQLAVNEQRDDETRSHPDRKADDVDQGIPAIPTERAKGDFEITG